MQFDQIAVKVRPRSAWESIDLGILMARNWWWPMCRAWLAVTLPAFIVLQLLLYSYPVIAIVIFWWLKPIWERPLLHILSRALFGEVPELKQTLCAFPGLAAKQWFASLTYRRLSLTRSMDLPVIQLENLKGKQRAQRLKVLHGNTGTGAGWLTFIGLHVEIILPLAFLALVAMMVPEAVEVDWQALFFMPDRGVMGGFNLLSYVVMSLVAPFYVAAGFSLYLNRRIRLEGWDLELSFRRLVQRVQTLNGVGKVAALLLAAVLACGWPPDAAMAQTLDRETAKSQIETVMADETFHSLETVRSLDWDWFSDEQQQENGFPAWLLQLIEFLAANLRFFLWVVVIALVLIFLYKQRDWLLQCGVAVNKSPRRRSPYYSVWRWGVKRCRRMCWPRCAHSGTGNSFAPPIVCSIARR